MTDGPDPQRLLVLVVDDDEEVRNSVGGLLEDEGFSVVTAANGAEAVRRLTEGLRPSVILLDFMMPVMSGWQVWDWLQARPQFADIPVVVFTATGMRSFGETPVLEKPVATSTLVSTLSRVAHRAA